MFESKIRMSFQVIYNDGKGDFGAEVESGLDEVVAEVVEVDEVVESVDADVDVDVDVDKLIFFIMF